MSDKKREDLTQEELEAAKGEPLPVREVMSIVSTDARPVPLDGGVFLDGDTGTPQDPTGTDDTPGKPGPEPMATDDRLEQ